MAYVAGAVYQMVEAHREAEYHLVNENYKLESEDGAPYMAMGGWKSDGVTFPDRVWASSKVFEKTWRKHSEQVIVASTTLTVKVTLDKRFTAADVDAIEKSLADYYGDQVK